ncbi:hypothetical protein K504DRAFT_379025 [Pleomassaria siparia CBS 279.74]|uniref:Ribosomal RNA-processing protein 40 n=1 Tax=Pleomassaria siparia CBS 279.74 TaxID=1314801 RepID=A0A6G1KBT9_9PLEO|nr:hypothetical protein K504DRAFT_379025 [Pleomassaria siparia CBS 279.74]
MSTTATVLLPGDIVPSSSLPIPSKQKKPFTLGPGLRHIPPSTITSNIAGALTTDGKKNAAWIDFNSGRFVPAVGDLVIATVNNSAGESFNCYLTPNTPFASLPQLAFEGATRKTRPQLAANSLVYARVTNSGKESAPEITCVDPSTGKSEGLGPLKGGMVFKISLGMARRLLAGKKGGVTVLEGLSKKVGFEVAIGRNGVLWVDGGKVKTTLAIGGAVQEVDEKSLGEQGQDKVVEKVLKGL